MDEVRSRTSEVENDLCEVGYWRAHAQVEIPSALPLPVNIELAAVDWLDWKTGTRGAAKNTRSNLAQSMSRFFRALIAAAVALRPTTS